MEENYPKREEGICFRNVLWIKKQKLMLMCVMQGIVNGWEDNSNSEIF